MALTAAEVFRDFVTDGIPSSGNNHPAKAAIRTLLGQYERAIDAFMVSGGVIYASKEAIDADLDHDANSMAWVVGDATAANNGIYQKQGASGTGSWTRVADLPYSFIVASDVGDGTPDAIVATSSLPISGSALVLLNIFEENTGSPVTVSFNGGAPLTIKTNSGNDIAPGGLAAGMLVFGYISGATFRLISDQVSSAIVAQAEDARDVAIAAAGSVVTRDYDTVSALSSLTVPSAAGAIRVFGNDVPGDDNGGEPVTLFRDTSEAKPAYLLDQDGNHFAYLSRVIKLSKMFHGAKTDGTGDNSTAIVAAIDEILEKGGGEIILPAGRYQTNGMSSAKTIGSTPIEFTFQEGAVLAGASGFSVGLIRLVGGSTVEREGKVTFNAPKLDCSLGAYTGNQPSGISLSHFIDVYVNEIDAYGGELYSNYLTTGVGGDSAVETVNVFNFQARGGKSKGFLDSDFYCGGGNDLTDIDDGGVHLIDGVTMDHSAGIRWKRAGRYLKAVNCTFFDCYLPVSSADVGPGQEVNTGQQMDVINNKMFRSGPRAIEYRAQTKGLCMGNVIQDVGFTEVGAGTVTSLGANQSFIFLNGPGGTSARKVMVSNNMLEMRAQSVNTQIGIRISDYTDQDSVLWSAGGIHGLGNHFTNIPIPLFDNGTGGASQFMKNFMGGGAASTFSHFQQGTVFEYQGGTPSAPATFQQRRTTAGVGAPTRYIDTAAFSPG